MRLILAVLFFLAALFGVIALVSSQGWLEGHACETPWWKDLLLGTMWLGFLIGLTSFTLWAFNRRPLPLSGDGDFAQLRVLAGKGDVLMQDFKARRAFLVAEYADEGPHYFLELEDGRILYLTGQGLYNYEPLPPRMTWTPAPAPSPTPTSPCSAIIATTTNTSWTSSAAALCSNPRSRLRSSRRSISTATPGRTVMLFPIAATTTSSNSALRLEVIVSAKSPTKEVLTDV